MQQGNFEIKTSPQVIQVFVNFVKNERIQQKTKNSALNF